MWRVVSSVDPPPAPVSGLRLLHVSHSVKPLGSCRYLGVASDVAALISFSSLRPLVTDPSIEGDGLNESFQQHFAGSVMVQGTQAHTVCLFAGYFLLSTFSGVRTMSSHVVYLSTGITCEFPSLLLTRVTWRLQGQWLSELYSMQMLLPVKASSPTK
jgi:hypothetical protein